MKHLPIAPPTWATDANYSAGPSPWSATPTRVAPSAGAAAAGFRPKQQPPAQWLNHQLGKTGDDLTTLAQLAAHEALTTWVVGMQPDSTIGNIGLVGVRRSTNVDVPRLPIVLGYKSTNSNRVYIARTPDGIAYSGFSADLTINAFQETNPLKIVGGAPGVLFNEGFYSTDYGVNWAAISGSWSPGPVFPRGVHYARLAALSLDRYFICYNGSAVLPYCATPGGTPTNGSFPEALAAQDVDFADNGKQTVVLCAQKNGNAFYSLYRSLDGGSTWSKTYDLSGTAGNVTYSEYYDQFVAWDSTGVLYFSADGSSWNTDGVSEVSTASGGLIGRGSLIACGPAIIKAITKNIGTPYVGIAYTLNRATSWFSHLVVPNASDNAARFSVFNGRVYARGVNNTIHVSGRLSFPSVTEF